MAIASHDFSTGSFSMRGFGRRGSFIGSMAISAFPRRRNTERFWPRDFWKVSGAEARRASCLLFGQRPQYFFRCDGHFVDPDAHRIVDCIGHGRNDREQRTLSTLLRAKRSARGQALR